MEMDIARESQECRAARMQALLRTVVVAALVAELVVFPPLRNAGTSLALLVAYVAGSLLLLMFLAAPRAAPAAPAIMVASPAVDLVAVTAFLAVSGQFSDPTWASPFVDDAFFLIPILAAFQPHPRVTLCAGAAAALSMVAGVGIGHRQGNPFWQWTLVHALFVIVAGAGCALISRIQQSRMSLIASLARHRSWLLARTMAIEEHEREELAEIVHDGALQSVLAARQDITEAARGCRSPALDRAALALNEATAQMRSSIIDLHPGVLETAGLRRALGVLAEQTSQRTGMTVTIRCDAPTAGPADRLLYRVARELLTNVVKHAHATSAEIRLHVGQDLARLQVIDDGVGTAVESQAVAMAGGHIGIASHRVRVEEAGGSLTIRPRHPSGTIAEATLPLSTDAGPRAWPARAAIDGT